MKLATWNVNSLAVRLPRDVAFPPEVKRVIITRDGARRIEIRDGKIAEKVDLTLAGLNRKAQTGGPPTGARPRNR